MQLLKRFLTLRRQDDRIKIMFLLVLIGAVMLINVICNSFLLYKMMQSPMEYILSANTNKTSFAALSKIKAIKNVTEVSHQQEELVTVRYQGQEMTFSCTNLSEAYLAVVYGIKETSSMKKFYINEKACEMLCQELGVERSLFDSEHSKAQINYCIESQTEDAGAIKESAAIFVLLRENTANDEPLFFCKGNAVNADHDVMFRVCIKLQEFAGTKADELEQAGFTIENMQNIQMKHDWQERQRDKIIYGTIVSLLCLSCAVLFWIYFYKHNKEAFMC